jgi:tetratricopeptide (TPR) repeat protein
VARNRARARRSSIYSPLVDDVASRKLTWPDKLNVGLSIVAIVIGALSILISWLLADKAKRDLDAVRRLTATLQAQSESSFAKEQKVQDAVLLLTAGKAGFRPSDFVGKLPVLADSVNKLAASGSYDEAPLPPPLRLASGSGRAFDYFQAAERADADGRAKAAIALLDTAIILDPAFQVAYHNRSYDKFSTGDTAGALADADSAVRLKPNEPATRVLRSKIRSASGNHVGALADCVAGLSVPATSDDKAWLFVNKGVAERHLRRYNDAKMSFMEAHRLRPRDASIFVNLSNLDYDQGRLSSAESLLTRALALDSTYADAWSYRGDVRYGLRNYGGALTDHSAAVRLAPMRARFHYRRALDFRELDMKDSAIADLQGAVKLDPYDPDALSSLGLCLAEVADDLVRSHRMTEARAKWLEAVKLYEASKRLPRMSPGRRQVVDVWLAQARERLEKLDGTPLQR